MNLLVALSAIAMTIGAVVAAPISAAVQAPFASLRPATTLHLANTADWVLPTADAIWIGGAGPFAIHRIDPATNREVASIKVPGEPCAGLASGFGSLWVPLCGKPNSLARIDIATNQLTAILPIGPAAPEGGIAAGGDSVWMVTNPLGALARIDPKTARVRQTVTLAPGSYNPLYVDGVVWVTGHDKGVVTAVDARSGHILAVVPVGGGPRFLTFGRGSIWVLLQETGEVVRIDVSTRKLVARIATGLAGKGGDISFGANQVWPTLSGKPLTQIDALTGTVRRQWVGPGGDSLAWAFGSIWLTDYKAGTVSRYSVKALGVGGLP